MRLRRFLITEPTGTSQKDFVARKNFDNFGYLTILAYARLMTQKQVYSVIADHKGFEVRRYDSCVLVQVRQRGEFMAAGNRAFGSLIGYISGANEKRQKIAMTAPVIQQPLGTDEHVISFVMPADFSLGDTPLPLASILEIKPVDEHLTAAKAFRGSWSWERFAAEGEDLLSAVAAAGLKTNGKLYWSRFDPPYVPGFLRHNEVLIDLV